MKVQALSTWLSAAKRNPSVTMDGKTHISHNRSKIQQRLILKALITLHKPTACTPSYKSHKKNRTTYLFHPNKTLIFSQT